MKFRTDESFLFPASQLDFKRDHINFPAGGLHGFGALNGSPLFDHRLPIERKAEA